MESNKAAYGLVEAPVEWYISTTTVLEEHGWRRLKLDPCCWIFVDPDLVKTGNTKGVMTRSECAVEAATGGRVDECAFVGKEGNKVLEKARKRLQDQSRWKMWESDKFKQCGVRVDTRRTEVPSCHRMNSSMNSERNRFQAADEKRRTVQCHNKSRQS